jgi:hypothetical protein
MQNTDSKRRLTDSQFVTKWCQAAKAGKTLSEFVESLNLPYQQVHGRYRLILSKGVELPFLKGQRSDYKTDSVPLNQIVMKIMGGS